MILGKSVSLSGLQFGLRAQSAILLQSRDESNLPSDYVYEGVTVMGEWRERKEAQGSYSWSGIGKKKVLGSENGKLELASYLSGLSSWTLCKNSTKGLRVKGESMNDLFMTVRLKRGRG